MSKFLLKLLLTFRVVLDGSEVYRCCAAEGSRSGLSYVPKPSPTLVSEHPTRIQTFPNYPVAHGPQVSRPVWIKPTWTQPTWKKPNAQKPYARNPAWKRPTWKNPNWKKPTWRNPAQPLASPPANSNQQEWQVYPSFSPSTLSEEPSSSTSDLYSSIPTLIASDRSSDSFGNTLNPSKNPSLIPSIAFSTLPSFYPSELPSRFPSQYPSSSFEPSSFPSISPTQSANPTTGPSFYPSDHPSIVPTKAPTASPTSTPSSKPTSSPSNTPSSIPSLACHDVEGYRSPLNNFTCSDHLGTDCTSWKFLGLDEDEVEVLIESCPVSCQVECGSLNRFNTNASYVISKVDNFLAPESVKNLEETCITYFTNYIEAKEPEGKFSLQRVQLLSQSILSKLPSGLRNLESGIDLSVSFAFGGFSIGIDPTAIEAFILDGIDSPGFLNALHSSGDATFASISINNASSFNQTDVDTQIPAQQSDRSPGAIPASIVVGLVAISFSGVVIFYKARRKSRNYIHEKDDISEANSPQASVRSPLLSVFSFESVIRLVASATSHPSDNSTCKGMTSGSDSSEALSVHAPEILSAVPMESNVSEETSHPLTGIVPPMILYNLSGESNYYYKKELSRDDQSQKSKYVVPFRKSEASESFRKSICTDGKPELDESMYDGVVPNEHLETLESYMCSSSIDSENDYSECDSNRNPLMQGTDILSSLSEPPQLRISVSESAMDNVVDNQHRITFRSFKLRRKRSFVDNEPLEIISSRRDAELWSCEITGIDSRPATVAHRSVSDVIPVAESETRIRSSMITSLNLLKGIRSSGAINLPKSASVDHDSSKSRQLMSYASNVSDSEKHKMLIFWAPVKGKLGLIIQCLANMGPIVTQVKDYSPLLGHVLEGDRIVEIDDISTIGMNITDVLSLLSSKQSGDHSSMLRLVVWRTEQFELDNETFEST